MTALDENCYTCGIDADMDCPQISFIVPAYNEAASIEDTFNEVLKLARFFTNYQIVMINDYSEDETPQLLNKLAASNSNVTVIHNERNKGFGASYRIGYQAASGSYCMLIPGDNSHPAETVTPIIQCMGDADIIIPYVTNPNARSKSRQFISWLFISIVNKVSGLNIPYYNGLVLHKTSLLRSVQSTTDGFAYQAEILVELITGGASYKTVATEIEERSGKGSKAFKLRNVVQVIFAILRLIRNRIARKSLTNYATGNM